jgi:murein DD-endopeptidase MepM/ murein hydrolase activator NlpD
VHQRFLATRRHLIPTALVLTALAIPTGAPRLSAGRASIPSPALAAAARVRPAPPYIAPVDGPIVDHFRPPACRWCPGNRGIDYATRPGEAVRASAAGLVTFAGPIGPDLYVTVQHGDGLRTSYAYLATVSVTAGQLVSQGTALGTAGASVHFGVRRGDVYLDPELLLAGGRLRARLVPTDGAPGRSRLYAAGDGPLALRAGS